ncbi:MAG: hypothetical protein PVF33_05790 [Candidatus Latescibacterota bacterium]
MRQILDIFIVGTVVAMMALPAGVPLGGSGDQHNDTGRSLQIGLGVRVDSDWIVFNGTWSVTPAAQETKRTGEIHRLEIGAVPNIPGRARKGAVLLRVLRSTTICVAKQLLTDPLQPERPEGK